MSEQYIEVVISNKELSECTIGAGISMLELIMERLTTAGVPVKPYRVGQAIQVETGVIQYTRNAMNQASVYIWKSDDYVKEHDDES